MNTSSTYINIRTNREVKEEAQKVASGLGVTLSDLLNSYLKQVVRTKKVLLSMDEEPSDYLIASINDAKRAKAEGKSSPKFTNAADAIKWLGI